MTIAFSLVAFAHGQSCNLLVWRSPSTLADGQSRTGYKVNEATFTQSCTGSAGLITCISGSVANGNIFKYPSCIGHSWSGCMMPTGANHLEYRTLYKLGTATYTQTCQQLSQSLQCFNWVFTWWITPRLYTFGSCTNTARAQCINIRNNSYVNHLWTIFAYTAQQVPGNQSCNNVKITLTCMNWSWFSWSNQVNQNSLHSSCSNGSSCALPDGTLLSSGQSVTRYSTILWSVTGQNYAGWCDPYSGQLTCINGVIQGNYQFYQYSLDQCTAGSPQSCSFTWWYGTLVTMAHSGTQTRYSTILWSVTGQNYAGW